MNRRIMANAETREETGEGKEKVIRVACFRAKVRSFVRFLFSRQGRIVESRICRGL